MGSSKMTSRATARISSDASRSVSGLSHTATGRSSCGYSLGAAGSATGRAIQARPLSRGREDPFIGVWDTVDAVGLPFCDRGLPERWSTSSSSPISPSARASSAPVMRSRSTISASRSIRCCGSSKGSRRSDHRAGLVRRRAFERRRRLSEAGDVAWSRSTGSCSARR